MTDERVRTLERKFQSTRSLEDEVALLAARLQAGDLSPRHLEIAYLCGHPAASALDRPRPLVKASSACLVLRLPPEHLSAWGRDGCPRVSHAGAWVYDLAAMLEWCAGAPRRPPDEGTLTGNLVRACGREDPLAVYYGGVAALRATLAERPRAAVEIDVVNRVVEMADRWLADPDEWSNIDAVLDALRGGSIFDLTLPATRFLQAIRSLHDEFAASGATGHGHCQITGVGEVVDQLVDTGSFRLPLGEWPTPTEVREYDQRVTDAVAPTLAAWALGRPARSSPRPSD